MTPLVNGVKSYSIYTQRLSPITVVKKILQYLYTATEPNYGCEKNLTVYIIYV